MLFLLTDQNKIIVYKKYMYLFYNIKKKIQFNTNT